LAPKHLYEMNSPHAQRVRIGRCHEERPRRVVIGSTPPTQATAHSVGSRTAMRNRTSIITLLAACMGMLIALPALPAPATLIKAEGKVWVTPPEGKEKPAAAGSRLDPGTRIRTGPSSSAELEFENGSVLKVRPNTSM